ncbi:TonB-dependent receptor [Sphingomonas sp. UV9]|uniref:TonB-dependent receptor n=1 Tax=Sphingomonas sp. UV9 TaxID=1851410 RepID=UPI000FFC32A7|nr:TonB-dependent receptor [Sphingomonas sp. UV9]RXD04874.1 TonB-dependent receptor [Sphingomonas sp. UV9]
MINGRWAALFLAGTAAVAQPSRADAQRTPSSDRAEAASSNSPADDQAVGEIVVTAQRVRQDLRSVPVSIAVVSGEDLQSRKIYDLTQLTAAVPGFQTGGDNSFTIRGVGSTVFSANIDSSVGVAVDEVSLGVPLFMSNGILDDIARVEVLQGPQGLLFGRNASAGLLNIVSNRPNLRRIEGSANIELNERDTVPGDGFGIIARGMINLPLSSDLAIRVNGLHSMQNPIAQHVAGSPDRLEQDQTRTAIRAKILYEPTDGTSIYAIGDYSRERGIGGIFDRTYRAAPSNGAIAPALSGRDGVVPGPENLRYGADADMSRSVDTYGISINASQEIGERLTLSNIAAWRGFDLDLNLDTDGTSANLLNINTNQSQYDQYSNELRLALAPGGPIDGQIGAYGFYSELQADVILQGSAGTAVPNYVGRDGLYRQTLRSLAGFGQFQYHVTPELQLIAGGRVTNDRITLNTRQNRFPYQITLGPRTPPARQTYSNTDFSWKLGTQYDVTPGITAYATYSRGYKGPSFNTMFAQVGQDLVIGPETVGDIELGLKSTLFDRRLRLNLSAFRELFKGFQVQALDVASGVVATRNAGRVRSQGVEITANARPLRGVTLNAGATWLDSRFRSFVGAACYLGQPNCLPNGTFDAAGLRTPASARFSSSLQVVYEAPAIGRWTPFVEGNWAHRSSVNFSSNGSPLTRLGAYDMLGGSIGVRTSDAFEVSIFCKNCTDKRIPTFIAYDSFDTVLRRVPSIQQSWGYNSVRTIGLSGTYRF